MLAIYFSCTSWRSLKNKNFNNICVDKYNFLQRITDMTLTVTRDTRDENVPLNWVWCYNVAMIHTESNSVLEDKMNNICPQLSVSQCGLWGAFLIIQGALQSVKANFQFLNTSRIINMNFEIISDSVWNNFLLINKYGRGVDHLVRMGCPHSLHHDSHHQDDPPVSWHTRNQTDSSWERGTRWTKDYLRIQVWFRIISFIMFSIPDNITMN